jgi:hypothetical protein
MPGTRLEPPAAARALSCKQIRGCSGDRREARVSRARRIGAVAFSRRRLERPNNKDSDGSAGVRRPIFFEDAVLAG